MPWLLRRFLANRFLQLRLGG